MELNTLKALLAFVCILCTTALMMAHTIPSEAGMPIITLVVGYVTGNGIALKTGKPVEPIIKPKQKDENP